MSLHDFIKILRQRWWVILLCTLVAAGAMFLATPARTDTTQRIGSYTATTTLLVGYRADPVETPGRGTTAPQAPVERASMARIALFITTGEVPRRAAQRLNYTGDPAVLASGIIVATDPASESITISTTAADGNRAALVANTFAEEAAAFFAEAPPGAGSAELTMLQEATPIPNQSTAGFVIPPDRNIRTALAALVGLLVGLAIALVLDRLDSRLRTRAEVSDALRMPVIAEVPRLRRGDRGQGKILTVSKPLSIYADGYRAARTALMHLPAQQVPDDWSPRRADGQGEHVKQAQVILLSSAHAAEGKSTSVANLAASFAETGQRVLVLDADLRSPDTHVKFDVPQGAGISDYLTGRGTVELADIVRPTSVDGVSIVTAGTRLDYPASLTSRLAPLIDDARQSADIVLIDTSPLLAASDVFDILPLADAIVLVVRAGRLTENAAHRVAELLGRFRVPVTGAILIAGHVRKADYGYGYGDGPSRGKSRRSLAATSASLPPREEEESEVDARPRRSRG
ncbi:AAA family ATPase [Propioniciclava sp. MC1595]|uniref:polysaccharide biosynthesis tyrosine autokinase n=1 Tax=Propioniciclava sp. MC1595 TaxID=2760308 RepID=UPI00166235BB|nr:polysaccharide biosynthesis tyrosine autokinase [Propioniciclava sp. MC1595]MBB1494619.1 AAA family ATPase [Propioniciclava sp. MC1595]QTE27389.1 AAA family ATPase [Propioniciclava sp. MC1595]